MAEPQSFDPVMLYRRQFLAGPRMPEPFRAWPVIHFSRTLLIGCHPELEVTTVSQQGRMVVCLGHILDPHNPGHGNSQVLERLLTLSETFFDLEQALAKLGGRWVLFVSLLEKQRVYHDAGGLKSVFFYADPSSQDLWVASQPGLFGEGLGLSPDEQLIKQFWVTKSHNSWVCELTPYPHTKQLLPNHFLDIERRASARFWPSVAIAPQTLERAAEQMAEIIHGLIVAVAQRGPVALPLTGGYESRVSFSCAKELRRTIPLYIVDAPNTLYYDRVLSKRVAKVFGLHVDSFRGVPFDERFWRTILKNTGEMWWDQGINHLSTLGKYVPNHYLLIGAMGTVARAWYYQDGKLPACIDARLLANVIGFAGNQLATEALEHWHATVPKDTNVSALDLLFWEYRQGNWASMTYTAIDSVGCETSAPFNSRELMEIALGVDAEYRKPPHALLRRICVIAGGEQAVSVPINRYWLEKIMTRALKPIPYRLKYGFFIARMKRSGVPTCALSDSRFY